jgi:hypothetical protein
MPPHSNVRFYRKRVAAESPASPPSKRVKVIDEADTPNEPAAKVRPPKTPSTPSTAKAAKKETRTPASEPRHRSKPKNYMEEQEDDGSDSDNVGVQKGDEELINISWPTLALGRSPTITEYDSVTVNGKVFKIGDVVSALFQISAWPLVLLLTICSLGLYPPGSDKKNYFMGKIVRICRTHKEEAIVRMQWFYRPTDAPEATRTFISLLNRI